MKRHLRVAGLMSGTSADGVSVAIADMTGRKVTVRAFGTVPYPRELRAEVLRVSEPGRGRVDELCRLNFVLGEVFAEALITVARRRRIPLASIDLIGSHGQTVCHLPVGTCSIFPSSGKSGKKGTVPLRLLRGLSPFSRHSCRGSTLQIAEPCVIAERTGITTVADFRPRDVAAGGEGAPLVPFADFVLFAHRSKSRCIQNIGGIANVTYLPASGSLDNLLAFDTGPGNMIIDALAQIVTRGKRHYDAGGALAAKGRVDEALLAELMRHPFLRQRPPKSTGREEFGRAFSDALYRRARRRRIPPLDILASVTAFTARSIADAYRRFLPGRIDEVILCGGGAHNRTLVRMLADELPGSRVATMDVYGIDPDAKEAVSFALLARETLPCPERLRGIGRPSNVPSATGARRPVVLGKIVPGK